MASSPRPKVSKKSFKQSLQLFKYIKPKSGYFIVGLLCLFVSSVSSLGILYQLGDLMDFREGNLQQQVASVLVIIIALLAVQALTSYLRIYTFAVVTEHTVAKLRQDVYSKLIYLPMDFFHRKRVGELSSRISEDIAAVQSSLTVYVAELIRQIIIVIGSITILTVTSVKLAIFMLATLPIIVLVAVSFGRYVRKLSKQAQSQAADAATIVEETLQGIATVKAFVGEVFEIKRYTQTTNDIIKTGIKNAVFRGLFAAFIVFFLFGSVVAIVWFGAGLVATGEISGGNLFQFFMLSVFMAGSVGGLADTYGQIQKSIGATEDLFTIMHEAPEPPQGKELDITQRLSGHIAFEQVDFSYPSRPDYSVLNNISFSVSPGQQVAIVGASGAGKTTLMNLILRFYNPSKGVITVDGLPIHTWSLAHYRRQIGLVPQDVLLFGGTIQENIRYAKPDATDEEIVFAAQQANAHEFITGFPDGYQTVVGERGTKLSGGQRQRIAIARAVLSNPAILLLDEATSSLDSESEKQVQHALERLMQGRTTLVIAHRLSTIRKADLILVFDKGKLVEQGTHQSLMQQSNGVYRHLASLQFSVDIDS